MLTSLGNGHDFKNGRQASAWLGLVPGQYSSGGKQDRLSRWAKALEERRGYWKAVVAIAAKNARLVGAVLAKGEEFKAEAA